MYCTKCGSFIPEGTKFCPVCGTPVETETPVTDVAAPKKFPILAIILPVVILLAAGIMALVIQSSRSSKARDGSQEASYSESSAPESSTQENSHNVPSRSDETSDQGDASAESAQEAAEASEAPAAEESAQEVVAKAPAVLELVTTDVSEYPIIKAYIRVEDAETGESIDGLTAEDFTIEEKVEGGKYVAREVKKVEQLNGNQGLNIALVADKSDSIYDEDMAKIKKVMIEFVQSLNYSAGDKAEVLAFDSIVQQMAYFTNDSALLENGINNMSTDGRTALYNAIHDGINHATLQGGARCVIAFTDGIDNESTYTPEEIVNYSLKNQVPVYIIGVGPEVDEYVLRDIAERTGGRYWFIDDLYDLSEIFNEIYAQQMEVYVVEYESDGSASAEAARELTIKVDSDTCTGEVSVSFTPTSAVKETKHESRYELIKGSYTWEEASQLCQEMGGHLATITSADENAQLAKMSEDAGLKYVWIGGYTSYDSNGNVFGHWVTGEEFSYENWSKDEPSRYDKGDNEPEWYLMLWNIPELGGWTWNDQRNDPVSYVAKMAETMGFICEYEE